MEQDINKLSVNSERHWSMYKIQNESTDTATWRQSKSIPLQHVCGMSLHPCKAIDGAYYTSFPCG